jgi:hypothetical protein
MYLISQPCPNIMPVGVWKQEGRINLKFGSPYRLELPPGLSVDERDKFVGNTIMRHIALLLPERIKGEYQ